MKIVFFGTPEMASKTLDALVQKKVDVVAVVTKPDTPQGRSLKLTPPPVKTYAEAHNIPVLQPEKASTPEFIEQLKGFHADLFVVVAYGQILSEALLASCPLGAINVHYSLLPKYRGAAPFQRALMNGDTETGVSVIKLVKKMDAGDVLASAPFTIPPTMNCGELADALCLLGIDCMFKVLDDFQNNTVKPIVQDHTEATLANKITVEECRIDWMKPAREINNQIRALAPQPGAWCEVIIRGEKKRLKIYSAEVIEAVEPKELTVSCGMDVLRLLTIQLEGKPKMAAADFVRGIPAYQVEFIHNK
ncbi:MAG: methionyl-tRNA formyltransferase [Verrucomicrobia bacterium]|nr:methionyl-tRNA formyltransferase [Verrucomicrobiota bacterium]MBS0637559.1 methionyl-tRNA formyltransferase [Verrucomicrobiota bacterium]